MLTCHKFIYFLLFILAVTIFVTEWRSKYRKTMNELDNKMSSIAIDSLLNFETIKHYNAEELEVERYKKAYKEYFLIKN